MLLSPASRARPHSCVQLSEDVMLRMMEEFEKLGAKEDFNKVLEGMMKQLLNKELMYGPMKAICAKVSLESRRVRSETL